MARSKKNNPKRREANRRLPLHNFSTPATRALTTLANYRAAVEAVGRPAPPEFNSKLTRALKTQTVNTVYSSPSTQPTPTNPDRFAQLRALPDQNALVSRQALSVCESRQIRKEVLFATNKAGVAGQKTPVWTELSRKKCK